MPNIEPEPAPLLEKRNNILQSVQKQPTVGSNPSPPSGAAPSEVAPQMNAAPKKRPRSEKQQEALRIAREKKREKFMTQNGIIDRTNTRTHPTVPKQKVIDPTQALMTINDLIAQSEQLHEKSPQLAVTGPSVRSSAPQVVTDASSLQKLFGDIPNVFKPPPQSSLHHGETWVEGEDPFRYQIGSISRVIRETPNFTPDMYTLGISSEAEIAKLETTENNAATWAYMKQRNSAATSNPGHSLESFHDTKRVGLAPSILRTNSVAGNKVSRMPTDNSF